MRTRAEQALPFALLLPSVGFLALLIVIPMAALAALVVQRLAVVAQAVAVRALPALVGGDIAARSVRYAEFNRRMNHIDNVTMLQGDMYEPVPLIAPSSVSNVSPE